MPFSDLGMKNQTVPLAVEIDAAMALEPDTVGVPTVRRVSAKGQSARDGCDNRINSLTELGTVGRSAPTPILRR